MVPWDFAVSGHRQRSCPNYATALVATGFDPSGPVWVQQEVQRTIVGYGVLIDQRLEGAGWVVRDASAIDLGEGVGISVREFPLTTRIAADLFCIDGRAICDEYSDSLSIALEAQV